MWWETPPWIELQSWGTLGIICSRCWRPKRNFSLRPEVTWKSSVLDKVVYLNGGHRRLFSTFIRPSQRYGGRERPRFCYLRLRWEFSIVPSFIQYLNLLLDHLRLEGGLYICSIQCLPYHSKNLYLWVLGVKTVLSLSSVTVLQTIFHLYIPKKDLAKPHSQISTKYMQNIIIIFCPESWYSVEKYDSRQIREPYFQKKLWNNRSNLMEEIYISW